MSQRSVQHKTTCNVCRLPITSPDELKPKGYVVVRTGRIIRQYKHDACAVEYDAVKTGLRRVVLPEVVIRTPQTRRAAERGLER